MQEKQNQPINPPGKQPLHPVDTNKNEHPNAVILPEEDKPATDTPEEEIKEAVKESLQDEDTPVEPVLGDDGVEVGGEG